MVYIGLVLILSSFLFSGFHRARVVVVHPKVEMEGHNPLVMKEVMTKMIYIIRSN